jgi:Tfp pilus assembly protein PilO
VKRKVPVTAVAAIAVVLVAAFGYFLLVKPKSDKAGNLENEIANVQAQIDAEVAADHRQAEPSVRIKVADIFRLTKAMPDEDDMAGIVLELNSVAAAAGVDFISISPTDPGGGTGYTSIPINLTFEGNYYDLTDFLFRLRNLVIVRKGVLQSDGRLFTLDTLDLQEGSEGFPQIQAALTVTAYVYAAAAAPAEAPAAPAPDPTASTGGES